MEKSIQPSESEWPEWSEKPKVTISDTDSPDVVKSKLLYAIQDAKEKKEREWGFQEGVKFALEVMEIVLNQNSIQPYTAFQAAKQTLMRKPL